MVKKELEEFDVGSANEFDGKCDAICLRSPPSSGYAILPKTSSVFSSSAVHY